MAVYCRGKCIETPFLKAERCGLRRWQSLNLETKDRSKRRGQLERSYQAWLSWKGGVATESVEEEGNYQKKKERLDC